MQNYPAFPRYGFNPGSTLVIHGYAHTMARTAVTTTLSAALGGLTGLLVKRLLPGKLGGSGVYDIGHTCNSLLGALVGLAGMLELLVGAAPWHVVEHGPGLNAWGRPCASVTIGRLTEG